MHAALAIFKILACDTVSLSSNKNNLLQYCSQSSSWNKRNSSIHENWFRLGRLKGTVTALSDEAVLWQPNHQSQKTKEIHGQNEYKVGYFICCSTMFVLLCFQWLKDETSIGTFSYEILT